MIRCGLVFPNWRQIGTVKWAGTPERVPLMNIEYTRCENTAQEPHERDGFTFHFCQEHRDERVPSRD